MSGRLARGAGDGHGGTVTDFGTGGMEGLWVDLALSRENGAKFRSLTN